MGEASEPRLAPRAAAGPADSEWTRLLEVAGMYYVGGLKIEEVAARLHLSRSTVSRELAKARTFGVVEFVLHRRPNPAGPLAAELQERFGVRAIVVDTTDAPDEVARLEQVAARAAERLAAIVGSDMTIAVAWGTTVEALARNLTRSPTRGTRVVQLNGSGNSVTTGVQYAGRLLERFAYAFAATEHPFPVPAFFDSAATRAAMWRERSIQRVLALRAGADVVVSSVGTLESEVPGHLYRFGYLDAVDLAELRQEGVVADLGSLFLRADGSSADVSLNARTTGMPLEDLRKVPTRLIVVAGRKKAAATLAALRAGAVTDLVIDDVTARAVCEA